MSQRLVDASQMTEDERRAYASQKPWSADEEAGVAPHHTLEDTSKSPHSKSERSRSVTGTAMSSNFFAAEGGHRRPGTTFPLRGPIVRHASPRTQRAIRDYERGNRLGGARSPQRLYEQRAFSSPSRGGKTLGSQSGYDEPQRLGGNRYDDIDQYGRRTTREPERWTDERQTSRGWSQDDYPPQQTSRGYQPSPSRGYQEPRYQGRDADVDFESGRYVASSSRSLPESDYRFGSSSTSKFHATR